MIRLGMRLPLDLGLGRGGGGIMRIRGCQGLKLKLPSSLRDCKS